MTNGNGSQFYFRVEDIQALITEGVTHIVINAKTDEAGAYSNVAAEAFNDAAAPMASKTGCPWPCGGGSRTITRESLEHARQVVSDASSQQPK